MEKYTDYIIDTAKKLLAIPSPTGFTHMAANFVKKELEGMGYEPVLTRKGAVLCDLGGKDTEHGLLLAAHMDTAHERMMDRVDNAHEAMDARRQRCGKNGVILSARLTAAWTFRVSASP